MPDRRLENSVAFYQDALRSANKVFKGIAPKEYGILLQGKRKKKKSN